MNPIPNEPIAAHAMLIDAVCADILSGDTATSPRAKAVVEIRRQDPRASKRGR